MELWVGLDAEQFAARAGPFVEAKIERNVLASVLAAARAGRYAETIFAVACDDDDETVAAAIRTPPHSILVAGEVADPDVFIATWMGFDPRPTGVTGDPALARSIADAWVRMTDGSTETHLHQALHVLTQVTAPQSPVLGRLIRADFRQSAQLGEWGIAFAIDANLANPQLSAAAIEHQLSQQRLYVWDLDGATVSLIGHSPTVAGTVRIGPVYTPPTQRGRGYATAATAALSQKLLDRGAERCVLYTDVTNPISNHIYAKIGYVRAGDWSEIAFDRPSG